MTGLSSILVDIDATATSQLALGRAAELARRSGARLRVVDVVSTLDDPRHALHANLDGDFVRWRRQQLRRIAHGAREVISSLDVLVGSPVNALLEDVNQFGHNLLVRAHARDLVASGPPAVRSVDAQLFRRCPCPVLALGPGAPPAHPHIAAAIDISTDDPATQNLSARVIDAALLFRRFQGGSLSLVHAWRPAAEKQVASRGSAEEYAAHLDRSRRRTERELAAFLEPFADRLSGVPLVVRRGRIEDILPAFVVGEGIDLVVLGSVGRTGLSRQLFGNTAERLLDRLPCSVLAVKSSGATALAEHLRRVSG